MVLSYPGFTASLAGAKDARGASFYHIQGERGSLRVRDGSNGLAEIQVVTEAGRRPIISSPTPTAGSTRSGPSPA